MNSTTLVIIATVVLTLHPAFAGAQDHTPLGESEDTYMEENSAGCYKRGENGAWASRTPREECS